jgi:hypothetical protein
MKPNLLAPLALLALVLLAGCGATGINPAAVDGAFRRVAARHDAYIQADNDLSPIEKRIDLRDTELLRGVLDAAKKTPATQPVK